MNRLLSLQEASDFFYLGCHPLNSKQARNHDRRFESQIHPDYVSWFVSAIPIFLGFIKELTLSALLGESDVNLVFLCRWTEWKTDASAV